MRERLIGIDAGGTTTKAALFDTAGRELACERRPNEMLFPSPGHTERDPDAMWKAASQAVSSLLEQTGTAPENVAAVSVSGYGGGIYLVDRNGDPVRPGIVSTDTRASGLVAEWNRSGVATAITLETQQRVWSAQPVALLAWFDEHEPETLERTFSALFCKDFLRFRLCGDLSTDPTDGGIAGLMDVQAGRYAEGVFRTASLLPWLDRMPEVGPGWEVVGGVSAVAASQTGLKFGTPVVRGAVDVTAAALACGVTGTSQLSVVAGTFSINSTLHARPRMSTPPFLQTAYPVGHHYLATEGGPTSAGNLEWFCRQLLEAEGARAVAQGRSVYDVTNELVASTRDEPNPILFFPFLFGGPTSAPAGFLGLSAGHRLADVLRAVYEGIAFAHKQDFDVLLSGTDAARPTSIRLAGGASRSAVWCQIFADTLGMPLETMQGSELSAQGVAICAAAAIGAYPDVGAAVDAMTRSAKRFDPDQARAAMLAAKFNQYSAAVESLGSVWAGLSAAPGVTARAA